MNTPILRVEGLEISCTNKQGTEPLVHQLSFDIMGGQVFGLVGGSGSGKTLTCMSILNILGGTLAVTGGSIELCGGQLLGKSPMEMRCIRGKEIAFAMQNPMSAFNPVMTIGAHFVETIRTHIPLSKREAIKYAVDYLNQVGLANGEMLLRKYPFQLSSGMLQRVMIAMAVCLKPRLLIADEPTTALDTGCQLDILKLLDRMRNQYGMSILLVSHDFGVIAQLADEVGVMCEGRLVERASVHHIFDSPEHEYTRALLGARRQLAGKGDIHHVEGGTRSDEYVRV